MSFLPQDPVDLLWGWPWTAMVLALAWIAAGRRTAPALLLWPPAIWLAVRLLDPVVGPAPPGPLEAAGRYVQAAMLAFGPPLLVLVAVKRRKA